ncbi:wavE lipopolysaccharide synthesis family protein [Synechococcus sp. PROS-7-1]|uniref:WavE lipopolysaccharide synthesis family protein n=1 Tax=Synechococcus sp. PROS-7-1 TaxID=1442556 RepID=UPI0016478F35|nr:WavE lipopolysaccharide synthesis family protein [Synechococcus sp. PROS-7-1]QNI83924.1 wavE lipopolysaccharide synthesis family protein [Synechococcus sp. PROS-7-1]
MNLNKIFYNNFLESGNLAVYDIFSTNFQYIVSGKPKNTSINAGIVIQGGVADSFTLELVKLAVRRYKLTYSTCKIIISTWDNINEEIKESLIAATHEHKDVFLILNQMPEYTGPNNGNLQIVSTINGARFAKNLGVEYVLKTRTDQIFGEFLFLDQLLSLHRSFKARLPKSQKGRIVVGSMGTFRARPFCVSDFFSFGFTDDIILMWDLKLDDPNQTPRDIIIRHRSINDELPFTEHDLEHFRFVTSSSRAGEGYFASNILYKSGRNYSYDWKDSEEFIASCFIVADTSSLALIWPKYGMTSSFSKYKSGHAWGTTFEKSTYGMSEINFCKWLEFYMELTDHNPNKK